MLTNDLLNEIKGKIKEKISFDLKIIYFNILISKGDVEKEFLNIFFETEREMIFSNQEKIKKYLNQKSFIDLRRFFIEVISETIFNIDLNEISKHNNIFSLLKEEFLILLNKFKDSKNISINLLNNSSICKLFLLIINVIYVKAKKVNFDIISYISVLNNTLILLESTGEWERVVIEPRAMLLKKKK